MRSYLYTAIVDGHVISASWQGSDDWDAALAFAARCAPKWADTECSVLPLGGWADDDLRECCRKRGFYEYRWIDDGRFNGRVWRRDE